MHVTSHVFYKITKTRKQVFFCGFYLYYLFICRFDEAKTFPYRALFLPTLVFSLH